MTPKRLLVVTTTIEFRHSSIPTAEKLISQLAQQSRAFTVDYVHQPEGKPAGLPRNATPEARAALKIAKDKWDEQLKAALEKMSAQVCVECLNQDQSHPAGFAGPYASHRSESERRATRVPSSSDQTLTHVRQSLVPDRFGRASGDAAFPSVTPRSQSGVALRFPPQYKTPRDELRESTIELGAIVRDIHWPGNACSWGFCPGECLRQILPPFFG